jgi:hypothetical protein
MIYQMYAWLVTTVCQQGGRAPELFSTSEGRTQAMEEDLDIRKGWLSLSAATGYGRKPYFFLFRVCLLS